MSARSVFVVSTLLAAAFGNPCASAQSVPHRPAAGCYARVDALGYNTLRLQLREDGTFYAELDGDIGLWGSSTGTWQLEGSGIDFTTTVVEDLKPLPDHVDLKEAAGHYAVRLHEAGFTRFSPLEPLNCDRFIAAGTRLDRKGAPQPMPDGVYEFANRSEEHPALPAGRVWVRITGRQIVVIRDQAWDGKPAGLAAEGRLTLGRNGRWIIAKAGTDTDAMEVGGCSDGPEAVDLEKRIYWTC